MKTMFILSRLLNLPKAVLLAGIALITGLVAALSLASYVQTRIDQVESKSQLNMVERIVAARDLAAGTKLIADHLAIRSFPADWIGSDTLPISAYENLTGKVLTTNLRGGDPFIPAHILTPKSALSSNLAPGRRAITLSVDVVNSLSGLLQPGDLIDLYVSFNYQRKNMTAPLLQGVMVLATGQETITGEYDDGHSNYSTITLDTAPEDVIKLVAARQAGSLTAILRNPADDIAHKKASKGDLAAILGLSAPAPKKKNNAVILYGSSRALGIPAWARPADANKPPANGLFDMPYEQSLSSPWQYELNEELSNITALNSRDYEFDDMSTAAQEYFND